MRTPTAIKWTYSRAKRIWASGPDPSRRWCKALRFAPAAHFTEYSRAEVEAAYHWTCHHTLEFLNATLKATTAGRQFLDRTPAQNGLPAHVTQSYYLPSQTGPVPTQVGSAAALAQKGFDHALALYRQAQQDARLRSRNKC